MTKDLFDQLVVFLLPEMNDVAARQSLVEGALHGSSVLQRIEWDGAARPFAERLVNHLERFGEVAPGEPALAALLKAIRPQIGVDRQVQADALLVRLEARAGAPARPLPAALQALLDAVREAAGEIALTDEQARAIQAHDPADRMEYCLVRIAAWALPRYALDKRFITLTMIVDKGEHEPLRWQGLSADEFRFNDLRAVLDKRPDDRALVVLGAPGSGKSTLLRRFQLDHSADVLRAGGEQISFFAPLNAYRPGKDGRRPPPRDWLGEQWARQFPSLPPLDEFLRRGHAVLLLDALNEMPHRGREEYDELIEQWRAFVQEAAGKRNRILFSCRKLDYSEGLSSEALPIPQIEVQPMNAEQMRGFLAVHSPRHQDRIWRDLDGSRQFDFFQTPYFLKLLCEQVETLQGELPKGRAGLFTNLVRQALGREREKQNPLFKPGEFLDERDCNKLLRNEWAGPFDLPERGALIPALRDLACRMQERRRADENAQVRVPYDDALVLIGHPRAAEVVQAGVALNVLDDDSARDDVLFFHQLLQEYFAARRLAREPKPEWAHVEWAADRVSPTLAETIAGLNDGDPLPGLPQTGWEETCLSAAPMANDPRGFIRDLMPHNLPLAGRCAASPEVDAGDDLRRELQQALIARTRDGSADLRARIAAGEALGALGDPRFVRRKGPHGEFLTPPLVAIPGGTYPMGDDEGAYDHEKPAHTVTLAPFQIGQFPVTNAEYKCFLDAGGYEDETWWDTEESRAWLRGEASTEGLKQQWRDNRKTVQGWGEDRLRDLVKQNRWTTERAENWIEWCNWTDERFEAALEELYSTGKTYRRPEFWDDVRFNQPSQPVVGVTWYEARAYCNWLTANAAMNDRLFRLPTEAEFEAAARGTEGRLFPYGNSLDAARCNTFESHIRRTTPVGIFDNATPTGAFDLSGNAYTWTLSVYDQQKFPYPYKQADGREDIHLANVNRVLRGGSWFVHHLRARAAYRYINRPADRVIYFGCRVVCVVRPPSHGVSDH
jgi:formylglycine-generating enzyme required for sulfatase activity